MTAISRPPAPETSASGMLRMWNSPTRQTRTYPTTVFSVPHSTFTIGEESPLPGGEANGTVCPFFCLTRGVHPKNFSPTSVQFKGEINDALPRKPDAALRVVDCAPSKQNAAGSSPAGRAISLNLKD